MYLIFVCSPYAGDMQSNTSRAKRYCRFICSKGSVPYAPHLHNPNFLSEEIPEEREIGIALGLEVLKRSDAVFCFGDKLTDGMRTELRYAIENDMPIKYFNEKCEEITDERFNQGKL